MKKRILAIFLACLMIASVLPMSVLAAEAGETNCPGQGEEHTLGLFNEAEIEKMKVEVVPSVCGEYGYTLYQCPDCDDYFAANFNKIEGSHDWETKEEAKPATCTEKGQKALIVCSICNKVDPENDGSDIPALDHDYQVNEDYDCEEGGVKITTCSRCDYNDEEKLKGQGHTWSDSPVKIDKEPDFVTGEPGIAIYECKDCGETKNVTILPECMHIHGLTEHKAVEATCTTAGKIAYWSCADCENYYADVNATVEVAKDENGNYIITVEALGHVTEGSNIEVVEEFPSTCTGEGWKKVKCGRCGKEVQVTVEPTGHSFEDDKPVTIAPTCTAWGFDVYACTVCGHVKQTNPVAPLGHTNWTSSDDASDAEKARNAKSKNVVKQDANCTTNGLVTWNCGDCDAAREQVLLATGHAEVSVTVDPTCSKYGYTFVYCSNDNCPLDAKSEYVKDEVSYDVTVNGASVKLIKCEVGKSYDKNNHNIADGVVNEATCTAPGNKIGFCEDCNEHEALVVIDPLGHDFDASIAANVTIKTPQDCENDEVITVKCSRCNETEDQTTEKKALGHNYLETGVVVAPNCIAGGYKETKCDNCGAMGKKDELPKVDTEDKYYMSIEDALKDHVNLDTDNKETFREGSCTFNGYYSHACADCKNNVLIVIEGTGDGHIDDEKYDQTGEVEDTVCGDGETTKGVFKCTKCGELIDYYLDHDWDKTKEVPADCKTGTDGKKALWVCKNDGCGIKHEEYDGATIVAEHDYEDQDPLNLAPTCEEAGYENHRICKVCGDEQKTVRSALNPGHTNMGATDWDEADCLGYGYQHWECEYCDYEYINRYVPALGHTEIDVPAVDPTCENTGLTAGKQCDVCSVFTVPQEEVPATGHHNAAGELIKCDTEDRFCVAVVGKDAGDNDILCGEVGDTHETVGPIHVDATCHEYGYDLVVCVNCEWSKVTNVNDEYLADHTWGQWIEIPSDEYDNEIMEERECIICGETEERVVEEIKIKYVLDIDNAVVSGADYSDSSIVVVKISIESLEEAVDVWGINFGLDYDEKVMSFVEAKFISTNFTTNPMAHAKNGVVNVLASVPNDENKATQNVTIDGSEAFVELYFRIDNAEIENYNNDGTNTKIINAEFSFVNCEARNNAGDLIGSAGEIESIDIVKYMDVDNDGDVNMADALMVSKIITGEIEPSYDVTVDVDKDGEITVADLKAICEYIVGSKGYDDMLDLGWEDLVA